MKTIPAVESEEIIQELFTLASVNTEIIEALTEQFDLTEEEFKQFLEGVKIKTEDVNVK